MLPIPFDQFGLRILQQSHLGFSSSFFFSFIPTLSRILSLSQSDQGSAPTADQWSITVRSHYECARPCPLSVAADRPSPARRLTTSPALHGTHRLPHAPTSPIPAYRG